MESFADVCYTFFMRKIIWLGIILVAGIWIYTEYYRWSDLSSGCSIRIAHSLTEWSSGNIKEALSALKFGYPEEYANVCRNTKKISPNMGCGGFGGGCFYGNEPETIYISTPHGNFIGWTASIIVHENCHVIQRKEGRPGDESECYREGDEVLARLVVY